ncbi:uncharacterized protein LOC101891004 [Musca domestica]|uniref:Uncharacterized protein LOC101891004 n=1 Tax=Musca domestica TaxID=7370 RepID=A0A1I8ND62_MUSDO|nr:uncharacterized protein LOC101891004 [Musca domestica]XP_005182076.1 uncharacterized protein LOC101891004 [Musca domestica]
MDMAGGIHDPKWSLERRESSGHLVWRKESPSARIRFRFDVEVLEFEKHPHEDMDHHESGISLSNISSTVVMCATCVAAVAVSVFLPWYLMEKVGSF